MKTPEEWMRDFEGKIAEAQAKAAAVQEGMAKAGGSVSSDDGAITVSIAPNGSLMDLKLTPAAMGKSHSELSAEIMTVARKAQRATAVKVAEAFEAANGAGSETLQLINAYVPAEEEPEEDEQPRHQIGYADAEPEPPTPTSKPQRRPAPRRDDGYDDDGDYSGDSIFDK